MKNKKEFELCADTLHACIAAAEGGADRIELCAALGEGGVTPSLGFLQEVLQAVTIPVHVLIRPRAGDFIYSDAEFRMMCIDIRTAIERGATGIVVGTLTPELHVDRQHMAALIRCAEGKPVTFHRAFDQIQKLDEALEILIDLGCHRVLTSGGKPDVMQGATALRQLAEQAHGRIRVAAGGGITLENAARFTAIRELDLHASLRRKIELVNASDPLWQTAASVDVQDVRAIRRIVHALAR